MFARRVTQSFVRAYGTLPTSNIKVTTSQLKESRAKEVSQTPDSLQLDTYEQVEAKINDPKESFMAVADSYKRYLQRLQMEESGPANSNHFSVYDGLARQPFTIDQYFNFIKGSEYDPDNWTIDQLEEFYFVPHPEPFSMGLYLQNLVAYRTLRRLGYRGPQQRELAKNYYISAGENTLEWLNPSPAPYHTYEELCIIKEPPSFVHGEHPRAESEIKLE